MPVSVFTVNKELNSPKQRSTKLMAMACTVAMVVTLPAVAGDRIMDCSRIVVPIDHSPARSPQAVHSVLAKRFRGLDLVEIGTHGGDGMNCFARFARTAVAIEVDPRPCELLRQRARALALDGHGNYSVICAGYQTATPDGDIYTWWQEGVLENEQALTDLAQMQQQGQVRARARAAILFDHKWPLDMRSWARLRPLASWHANITYDECTVLHDHWLVRTISGAFWPSWSAGKWRCSGEFTAAEIPLWRWAAAKRRPLVRSRWNSVTRHGRLLREADDVSHAKEATRKPRQEPKPRHSASSGSFTRQLTQQLGCNLEGLCWYIGRPLDGSAVLLSIAGLLAIAWLVVYHRATLRSACGSCGVSARVAAAFGAGLGGASFLRGLLPRTSEQIDPELDPEIDASHVTIVLPGGHRPLQAVLVLYGVVPRGIRTTMPMIDRHIVQVLRRAPGLVLRDVAVFNIDTANASVDVGAPPVNQSDVALVPATLPVRHYRQEDIDKIMRAHCLKRAPHGLCRFAAYPAQSRMEVNALRQIFIEHQVGRFLLDKTEAYDVAIVCNTDLYLALDVSLFDVRLAASSAMSVHLSAMADTSGSGGARTTTSLFTDGFYLGAPLPLSKVLRRKIGVLWLRPAPHDFEAHLRRAFVHHGIERRPTSMHFFKVRAGKAVHWQPYMTLAGHYRLMQRTLAHEHARQRVLAAWRSTAREGHRQKLIHGDY